MDSKLHYSQNQTKMNDKIAQKGQNLSQFLDYSVLNQSSRKIHNTFFKKDVIQLGGIVVTIVWESHVSFEQLSIACRLIVLTTYVFN